MATTHYPAAVIIPTYNEESSIREIILKISHYTRHIIVVNDGSTDQTCQQLLNLPITLLNHTTNQGKGAALLTGFRHAIQLADINCVITIDADGQHDPDDIPRLYEAQQHHAHSVVIGARLLNTEHAPKSRYRANKIADFFIAWAAGQPLIDSQSGLRCYPKSLLKDYCKPQLVARHFTFESALLIDTVRQGYQPVAVPIASLYPAEARASHYQPVIDTLKIIKLVSSKIIMRGFKPMGLWRRLFKKPLIAKHYMPDKINQHD